MSDSRPPLPAEDQTLLAQDVALVERLVADQRRRWHQGERPLVEAYLAQEPALQADAEAVVDLIYNEVLLREEAGETPALAEYLERFPQFARPLEHQFEVDQALRQGSLAPPSLPGPEEVTSLIGPAPRAAVRWHSPAGYEILREVGRGGMGVVYEARQKSLGRVVALKMVLAGNYVGPAERARFRQEAEAAARLQHPNIVQIHEVGECDGLPFLSLEFVEGGSLSRLLNGTPQPPLPAAGLVATLAEAMHHAHQQGIIHRDLKPANILLAGGGRQPPGGQPLPGGSHPPLANLIPKIADFGLAKLLRDEAGESVSGSPTQTGDILGTPSYMAPEQATGQAWKIGPATDVYALGAILYELLTGRPPFRGTNRIETLLQVQTQEPVSPRRLQPGVPRDLETICLKCLHKEPQRRYAGAAGLADDLQRFLAGRPIQARPVGVLGRVSKWARRRPAVAGLLGVSGALLLALVVVVLVSNVWLTRERDTAREQRRQAEHNFRQAEANFRQALEAVDQMLREVGEEDLADVPQMEPVRKKLLLKALGFYGKFLRERGDDPAVRRETGRAFSRLGDVQEMLGDHAPAEAAYRRAIALLQPLAGSSPPAADHRRELARSQTRLGVLLKKVNRFPEGEKVLRQALRHWQELAGAWPGRQEVRQGLADSYYHLGALLAPLAGRGKEAADAYRRALALQEKLATASPDHLDYQRGRARTLNNLGILLHASGEPEAAARFRQAKTIQQSLVDRAPTVSAYRRELARSCCNLATVLTAGRAFREAERSYRRAADLLARLAADFPTVPDYQQELAAVRNNLGRLFQSTRQPAAAEQAFRQALDVRARLAAQFPTVPVYRHKLALLHLTLGSLLAVTGRPWEAERAYAEALALQKRLAAEYPRMPDYQNAVGCTLNNQARLLFKRGELGESRQRLELACRGAWGGPLGSLGVVLQARASLVEARRCLHQAIQHQQTAVQASPRNPFYRQCLRNDYALLATIHLRLGEHAQARTAAEALPRLFSGHYQEYVRAAQFLAQCVPPASRDPTLPAPQRRELADVYCRRAVELLRQAVARRFDRVQELKRLPAYQPLRGREDFNKLLSDLSRRGGAGTH
jgi:serine/threonine protein kinase/tetratricopeptide (TPR) repeat protein